MRFMWLSDRWKKATGVRYSSSEWVEAACLPGVRYKIARASLARRAEITRRVRCLLSKLEYQEAGAALEDRLAAAEAACQVDRSYIEWGLLEVEGLRIDGRQCDVGLLVEKGPEPLCREIARRIRQESSLNAEERKN
jgi:hypothetical protein